LSRWIAPSSHPGERGGMREAFMGTGEVAPPDYKLFVFGARGLGPSANPSAVLLRHQLEASDLPLCLPLRSGGGRTATIPGEDGPIEGDVKRHFFSLHRKTADKSRGIQPRSVQPSSWFRSLLRADVSPKRLLAHPFWITFTLVTAPLEFRGAGKRNRCHSWQPWSYRRLVAYSFLGLSEGA
jgi:hypothetical protein